LLRRRAGKEASQEDANRPTEIPRWRNVGPGRRFPPASDRKGDLRRALSDGAAVRYRPPLRPCVAGLQNFKPSSTGLGRLPSRGTSACRISLFGANAWVQMPAPTARRLFCSKAGTLLGRAIWCRRDRGRTCDRHGRIMDPEDGRTDRMIGPFAASVSNDDSSRDGGDGRDADRCRY
jgi:hypothetical protein